MPSGVHVVSEREWGEGPEGDKDVLAYVEQTPALFALLFELHLVGHLEAEDHDTPEWETIFTIANHWRENDLTQRSETGGSQWIPVSERMPDDGDKVLCRWEDGWMYVGYWLGGEWMNSVHSRMNMQNVTHWMPLPEAPK